MKVFIYNLYLLVQSFVIFIFQVFPDNEFGNRMRGKVYKLFSRGKIGRNFQVSKSVNILAISNLTVGDDVYIGYGSWINAFGGISIDSEVMIGPLCSLSSANHTSNSSQRKSYRWGTHCKKPIRIGFGVWLGAGVVILPGTTIGDSTVVGAGATCRGNLDENALYIGQLAKKSD